MFWYERGNKHDLCVYDNESAACYGFLGLIGGALRGKQPLDPGRGTAGALGGVPINHRTLQGLLDGADLFGGMGEPQWARQFVAPEDFGASSGRRRLIWPDQSQHPDGFLSPTHRSPTRIPARRIMDSFGTTFTRFLYDTGALIPERSLPIDMVESGYRRWRVLQPTPVWVGPAAPWFGLPGGANQYFTLMPVVDLVGSGFIEEIKL
ncbi:TNT domain-containing protein [Nocardia sp. CA-290969]|uniref:TNT domain-containing protein n=1 Tax=Nocardia sp. CA-290969 TaxID=3239986 RepID=UPI003D913AD5